jgi:hypothetical protein
VVRFSDTELETIRARAALAELAVAAWIGPAAAALASGELAGPAGLPDLLRLHADVVLLERVGAAADAQVGDRVAAMLVRLDNTIDAAIAEMGRVRS